MSSGLVVEGPIQIAEIEGKGRGLIASQPIRAGEIVLRDSPILLYPALPQSLSYCCNCFKSLQNRGSVVSCPSCCFCLFCSPNCTKLALSSSHTAWVCRSLSRLREFPSLQTEVYFLIAAYNIAALFPSKFRILMSLQGVNTDASIAASLHSLVASLSPPHIGEFPFSVELTAALLAKDKLNAFGLMEPLSVEKSGERSVRAYGIYPKASFFNHDCLPNACRFDYVDADTEGNNTDIVIRAIHDILQGREICLSYFPVNENYSNRQKILFEDYGFTCACDRCKVEANWSDEDKEGDANEEEVDMEEDSDEQMEDTGVTEGDSGADFPHAYFFLRYMCDRNNCWGTLAPLPPSSDGTPSRIVECNVCGNFKNEDEEIVTDTNDEDGLDLDD